MCFSQNEWSAFCPPFSNNCTVCFRSLLLFTGHTVYGKMVSSSLQVFLCTVFFWSYYYTLSFCSLLYILIIINFFFTSCLWIIWTLGLDFVRPLTMRKTWRCRYIVVAMEYLTKWLEEQALLDNFVVSMTRFIYEHIITRYKISIQLASNCGGHLVNHVIWLLTTGFKIYHFLLSLYYPRENGQEKATKKSWLQ